MGDNMAYSAMAVANAFVKRAKAGQLGNLSPMKLQKLLFFAQSWHLARNHEPLIDEFFCRWQYGPVVASLYHEFKEYGAGVISAYGGHIIEKEGDVVKIRPVVDDSDTDTWELIDDIIRVYGPYSGSQLSAITHEPGSAWHESGEVDGGPIPNADLARYIHNNKHFHAETA
jgi:uncharacterized phage-associated protein